MSKNNNVKSKKTKSNFSTAFIDKNILLIIVFLICVLVMHIPFLKADPDTIVDPNTRGAWTDEGLYTSQIANYINTGNFDIKENNQFILSPLFNVLIYPFYRLFGCDIFVSRILVLSFFLLSVFICFMKVELRTCGLIFIPVALTQYHIFHFSHYSMPEMICISWILLAFASVNKFFYSKNKNSFFIFLSSLMIFFAYCTKIQFLSSALILPATMFFYSVKENKKGKLSSRFKPFLIALVFTFIFFIVYILLWYFPEKNFYDTVWAYETEGRFPKNFAHLWQLIKFHAGFTFWIDKLKPLLIFGGLSLLFLPFIFINKETNKYFGSILFVVFWIIAEFVKVSASYLPYRYLLALFIAVALLSAMVFSIFFDRYKIFKYFTIITVSVVLIININFIYKSFNNRTYNIERVNKYLSNYDFTNKTILGVWSHTLARETNAKCITVRRNYLNDKQSIEKYKPSVIITEHNEADSDSAFFKQGIILNNIADSINEFNVWRYKINVCWLKY